MSHKEHKEKAEKSAGCAVLTISDSRSKETDDSGKIIMDMLKGNNHRVILYDIVKDEKDEITGFVNEALSRSDIDAVITNGGTGMSKRDITVEAISGMIEKKIPGFGELFRYLSYKEIGSAAMMSGASAGVCRGKVIISLPGSKNAVKLAMAELVLPEIGHIVWELKR